MKFYQKLKGHAHLLISDLSIKISNSEVVCRYVYDKSKVLPSLNRLKRTAFEPPKSHPTEISVFRTTEMTHDDIIKLSKFGRDKDIVTYGLLLTEQIRGYDPTVLEDDQQNSDSNALYNETCLNVVSQPYPHYRHGNIINIPPAYSPIEKAAQKLITMKLSKASQIPQECNSS